MKGRLVAAALLPMLAALLLPPSAHPRRGAACRGPKLRAEVAKALKARNAPQLVFRRDAPTAKQVSSRAAPRLLRHGRRRGEQRMQSMLCCGACRGVLQTALNCMPSTGPPPLLPPCVRSLQQELEAIFARLDQEAKEDAAEAAAAAAAAGEAGAAGAAGSSQMRDA